MRTKKDSAVETPPARRPAPSRAQIENFRFYYFGSVMRHIVRFTEHKKPLSPYEKLAASETNAELLFGGIHKDKVVSRVFLHAYLASCKAFDNIDTESEYVESSTRTDQCLNVLVSWNLSPEEKTSPLPEYLRPYLYSAIGSRASVIFDHCITYQEMLLFIHKNVKSFLAAEQKTMVYPTEEELFFLAEMMCVMNPSGETLQNLKELVSKTSQEKVTRFVTIMDRLCNEYGARCEAHDSKETNPAKKKYFYTDRLVVESEADTNDEHYESYDEDEDEDYDS